MILGAGYGTVSDIEIVWIIISTVGFGFACWNATQAWGDRKYLESAGIRNGRWAVARLATFTESGRAYVQLFFMSIGLIAMHHPDPPASGAGWLSQAETVFARWGFISCAAVICAKSIYTFQVRKQLIEEEGRKVPSLGERSEATGTHSEGAQ